MAPSAEYVAGFLDADGCIVQRRNRVEIEFYNVDRDVLEQIQRTLTVGKIHRRAGRSFSHATQYRLRISTRAHVAMVLDLVGPFLILKRDKAAAGLAFLRSK